MACILLHHIQTLSQIVILLLQLEDFSIAVVQILRLPLDGLSERQIALQHLFHHVHRMDDPFSDGILRLIHSTVRLQWIHVPLIRSDVPQLVSLVPEKLVYFLLVFYYALGDDLPVLYLAILRFLIRQI